MKAGGQSAAIGGEIIGREIIKWRYGVMKWLVASHS